MAPSPGNARSPPVPHPLGHNNGPPLESPHPWGEGPVGRYFDWKAAVDAAWTSPPVGAAD